MLAHLLTADKADISVMPGKLQVAVFSGHHNISDRIPRTLKVINLKILLRYKEKTSYHSEKKLVFALSVHQVIFDKFRQKEIRKEKNRRKKHDKTKSYTL